MKETIRISDKITWIVAEPDTTIIQEKPEIEIIKEAIREGFEFMSTLTTLDLVMMVVASKILDWRPRITLPARQPKPTKAPKRQIEVGSGWYVVGQCILAVLQVLGIVLGNVAQVMAASMASSICW